VNLSIILDMTTTLRSLALLAFSTALHAQSDRFPQLKLEDTTADQRPLAERMLKETRIGLGGPWNVMLRSPDMSKGLLDLYNYFRWKTALPQPLVELAILTTAREWSVQFEWFAHYPIALKAGLSPALIADLRVGKRPENLKPEETVAYDFTTELCRNHFVSDPTFQKAKTLWGEKTVVDLTSLIGTYISIGALLNIAEVKTSATGGADFLPPLRH